ncbi:antiviral reverse transcriptase Drt3b [Aeromonas hydrophila]|uniref:antiviral reverse transcriptase Drt3b n=1 Tax=Aeromonas hydrophila TaxID=644 RepID=UPI003985DF91
MKEKGQIIYIDKKDKYRAILTDTCPFDAPIIFSNDGLYLNVRYAKEKEGTVLSAIFRNILDPGSSPKKTRPFKYRIAKGTASTRQLSLIHPSSQISLCDIYGKFSQSITYLCSKSNYSIRSPKKICNTIYINKFKQEDKLKGDAVQLSEGELFRRYVTSFYSYKGYSRIHRFFTSFDFIKQEKKFPCMGSLDISNCFNSIYTHSIAWAIKNKDFVKENVDFKCNFSAIIDVFMQRSNDNETNGIPIGSEFSRIFNEIILQRVDLNVECRLEHLYGIKNGEDYVIYRYVDDFIIFSMNVDVYNKIKMILADELSKFNLVLNQAKEKYYERPITTEQGRVSYNIIEYATKYFEPYLKLFNNNVASTKDIPTVTRDFINYFIQGIKSRCVSNRDYIFSSSLLVSVLSKRLEQLIYQDQNIKKDDDFPRYEQRFCEITSNILELMFFFHSISPSPTTSNKLSKSILILSIYMEEHHFKFSGLIKTRIMEDVKELSFGKKYEHDLKEYVSLENLNIVLSVSNFGSRYALPTRIFEQLLENDSDVSYFTIISLLFYFKDKHKYSKIKEKLIDICFNKLAPNEKLSDLKYFSEKVHLFLDLISCPYVSDVHKLKLLDLYREKYGAKQHLAQAMLNVLKKKYWFVNWQDIDLVQLIERRELHLPYH